MERLERGSPRWRDRLGTYTQDLGGPWTKLLAKDLCIVADVGRQATWIDQDAVDRVFRACGLVVSEQLLGELAAAGGGGWHLIRPGLGDLPPLNIATFREREDSSVNGTSSTVFRPMSDS